MTRGLEVWFKLKNVKFKTQYHLGTLIPVLLATQAAEIRLGK
jgi:hypothetical protein